MSLLSSVAISAAATVPDTVLLKQGRRIQNFIPDCVISEEHHDATEITSHPVERGSNISDHAYDRQSELRCTVAWSESKSVPQLIRGAIGALTGGGSSLSFSMSDVYAQLLALKATKQPFDVVTGKRTYKDMLFAALSVSTDRDTEYVLMVEATFRQVLITDVAKSTLPPVLRQLDPSATAAPVNAGQQQAQTSTLVTNPSSYFSGGG